MTKFNPKEYRGKARIFQSLPGHRGISRVWVWNQALAQYEPPPRGNRYAARRYELFGKRRVRSPQHFFATLDDALNWQLQVPTTTEVEAPKRASGLTFANVKEQFKKYRFPLLSAGTRLVYERLFPIFEFFDDFVMEDITPKVIDRWVEVVLAKDATSRRRHYEKEYETLRSIMNWYRDRCEDSGFTIPLRKRHKEALRANRKKFKTVTFMSVEQKAKWLEILKKTAPNLYAAAFVQVEQLLRVSEVYGMRWSNLDLENRTYRLCQSVEWLRKGGVPPRLKDGTKTIEPGDCQHLLLRQSVVDELRKLEKSKTCDLIFHRDGALWTYREIQHRYNRAFKKAELPFTATHILRHTGATQFLEETGDPLALKEMGGWATLDMAMHYGKVMNSRVRNAIEKADQKRSSAP